MSGKGFAPRSAPVEVRFWSRVDRRDEAECWPWLGSKDDAGYGRYTARQFRTAEAHRIAYELMRGPIPTGLVLDHLCRNPSCVNPAHLEPVTSRENSRRSPLVLKDECPKGHPYVEGSYYIDRGLRSCRQCKRQQVADYAQRTGRTTATFTCELCGETRNLTGRSRHMKRWHPEHYTPRAKSEGLTPEKKERRLAQQRERRRAATARKRHAASEALYVDLDGYGDLTIFLPRPGHPFGDWPVMSRTDRNALGFDALVALVGGQR